MSEGGPMRSTPVARRGSDPGSHEFRVRFARRLRGARIVSATEVIPPITPVVAPPVVPPPPAAVSPPPAPPSGFVQPDITKELREDRARIESALTNIQQAVDGLRTDRAARLEEMRQAAGTIGLALATRLLHEQIDAGAFAIEEKIRDMVAQLGDDVAVTVRLNPADLALLNQRLNDEPLLDDQSDPRFVADPNLGRGDCQVEGRESTLLSDLTRDLDEMREDLLRRLKNARS